MITDWGFDKSLHRKCNIFGHALEHAAKDGLDVINFVKAVMTDPELDWLYITDDCQEWCDAEYLYAEMCCQIQTKQGDPIDPYVLWFLGYLYKYWMTTRNMTRYEVYKILPIEKFLQGYAFWHTQDWDFIIEDATDG